MTMPFVPILIAIRDEAAQAVDGFVIRSGSRAVLVRHARHRDAKSTEYPAVTMRYVSDDIADEQRQTTAYGLPELVMALEVDFDIDLEVAPEADEFSVDDPDPTGWGDHAAIWQRILDRFLPGDLEPNTFGGRVWDVQYMGTAPTEGDSTPDNARLSQRVRFLYRVRADKPTELLTEGNQ